MASSDLELLARYVKTREAEAFAEVVARHRDMVYGVCHRLLGNRADAEDTAQECFLQLVPCQP
jgi:RNA polymerase sigma-70 factor (ECF subfamily)